MNLSDREATLLAGMLYARGKLYVGRAQRSSGSTRWLPSWSLELSGDAAQHWPKIAEIFGEPKARAYYGRTVWRYSIADRNRISELAYELQPYWPTGKALCAKIMAFCKAPSAASADALKALL